MIHAKKGTPGLNTEANAINAVRKRGRPSNWDKFCQIQGDLFASEKRAAELLRLPAFRLVAAFAVSGPVPGARPQRGTSEDAPPGAASR